jgi:hypothetical protein
VQSPPAAVLRPLLISVSRPTTSVSPALTSAGEIDGAFATIKRCEQFAKLSTSHTKQRHVIRTICLNKRKQKLQRLAGAP